MRERLKNLRDREPASHQLKILGTQSVKTYPQPLPVYIRERRCVFCVQGAVERAKMQLKSAMMMNLESRFILCEDIGRSRSPSPNSLFPLPYLCFSAPHSLTLLIIYRL